jgi:deoxycytidine triphosphate deaminase
MARIGLEHMNAGWCDAGWQGSVLTLEFKNMTRFHSIRIRPGDAIGQMVFFRHAPVSYEASYAARGRYNNNASVEGIRV